MTRIALLSDIHCGKFSRTAEFSVPGIPLKDENNGSASLTESLVSILKEKKVQYIFVAGDLTSEGSPQEFHYCEQKMLAIANETGIPRDNLIIGLGNHDIDWKITQIPDNYPQPYPDGFPIALAKEKYQLLGAHVACHSMQSLVNPGHNSAAPFSGIIQNENFLVFVLNSGWCCTHDQAFKHGKLSKDQLSWFESAAIKYAADVRWKIVLMHHHPFSYKYPIHSIDISMLEEGASFLEVAGKNGINLVLHGHRHHPRAETSHKTGWKAPITFICAGSLTVNSEHRSSGEIPNTIHIIELENTQKILKLYNYKYTPMQGWIPITENCPATPLDYKMILGRLPDNNEIDAALRGLTAQKFASGIRWEDLDECLQLLSVEDLNKKVKAAFAKTHKKVGSFPDEIILVPNGGTV